MPSKSFDTQRLVYALVDLSSSHDLSLGIHLKLSHLLLLLLLISIVLLFLRLIF